MASFFYYGRPSSATLVRWQARSNGIHIDHGKVENSKGLDTMDTNPYKRSGLR